MRYTVTPVGFVRSPFGEKVEFPPDRVTRERGIETTRGRIARLRETISPKPGDLKPEFQTDPLPARVPCCRNGVERLLIRAQVATATQPSNLERGEHRMVSLGFSDLNEDEALLVAIYRDWLRQGGEKGVVEDAVARALSQDALREVLDAVFAAYRRNVPDDVDPSGVGPLLSRHEERLLDTLSGMARPACPRSDDGASPHALNAVRPAAEIRRSGQDELMHKVNMGFWSMAPGF